MTLLMKLLGTCRIAGASFLLGAALALSTGSAVALTDAELVSLIAQGRVDEARSLFEKLDPDATDWIFFAGRVAKSEGKLDAAASSFREVLRREPSYLNARRELAHTLFLKSDFRGASHHFRHLLRVESDRQHRMSYVQFLNEIDVRRPFALSASLAIVSSSNVNRGSSQSVFNPGVPGIPSFDITSRAESGTGIELGLFGRHRWSAKNAFRWTFDWGLTGRKFPNKDHDLASLFARLQLGKFTQSSAWRAGPFARLTWRGNDSDSESVGFGASINRRVGEATNLFVSANTQYRRYWHLDGLDGPLHDAQIGLSRSFPKGVFDAGLRFEFSKPETPHQEYLQTAVFANVARSWPGGLHADMGFELGQRRFPAEFPLAGVKRRDEFIRFDLSLRHDAIRVRNFTPTARCSIGTTHSNVAFYDHDVTECTIGISRRF